MTLLMYLTNDTKLPNLQRIYFNPSILHTTAMFSMMYIEPFKLVHRTVWPGSGIYAIWKKALVFMKVYLSYICLA